MAIVQHDASMPGGARDKLVYHQLFQPLRSIQPYAEQAHKLSRARLTNQPIFSKEHAKAILGLVSGGRALVGHDMPSILKTLKKAVKDTWENRFELIVLD